MTTTTYKGYKIKTVGISQYIYRPGAQTSDLYFNNYSDGYAQSMAAAKRWINEDLASRLTHLPYAHNCGKVKRG